MKSKNKLALFLLLVLTIMIFSGCKKSEAPSASHTSDTPSVTDAPIIQDTTEPTTPDKEDYRVFMLA